MGKPVSTETTLRALPVGEPTVRASCPDGTTAEAIRLNPHQHCEAVFKVGNASIRVGPRTSSESVRRKVCHRNGMCLPKTKGGKAYLQELTTRIMTSAFAAINQAPVQTIIDKFEAGLRRKDNQERRERRKKAEEEMRSAMRNWDFTLEEVTQMWHEREVDAVHEL